MSHPNQDSVLPLFYEINYETHDAANHQHLNLDGEVSFQLSCYLLRMIMMNNSWFMAARYNDIDDIINLASEGVSLDLKDSQGRTALHMAAANGHLEVVDYLIRNGADPNASNMENNTPLHYACLNGHTQVVTKLTLAGANVAALNSHEKSPVDEALSRGKMEVVAAIDAVSMQMELDSAKIS
ncbi:hypothetical protein AMTRI_Chr01g105130 [Amborella trichopoda]